MGFSTLFIVILIMVFMLPVLRCRDRTRFFSKVDFYSQIFMGYIFLLIYGLVDFGVIDSISLDRSIMIISVMLVANSLLLKKIFIDAEG